MDGQDYDILTIGLLMLPVLMWVTASLGVLAATWALWVDAVYEQQALEVKGVKRAKKKGNRRT